jgi:hypothetical protein
LNLNETNKKIKNCFLSGRLISASRIN